MLGDLVSYKGKMSCKITAICKDTAVVDNDTGQDWRIDYNKLTPIPLTAEILEKNFLVQRGEWTEPVLYFFSNDYIEISIKEYTDGVWEITIDEVEMSGLPTRKMFVSSVHELQHALRLCNIEKTIEL